jgi:hypothetical protein
MDECQPEMAPLVFPFAQSHRAESAGGILYGASNKVPSLSAWIDVVDVLGVHKYPISGPEKPGGYPLHIVGENVRAGVEAVYNSRPIMPAVQFFPFRRGGRFPTREELRSMSYQSIVGGARGVSYWSIGVKGVAWICKPSSDWCPERVERWEDLKAVVSEIKSYEPALISLEEPAEIAWDNQAIYALAKRHGGKDYVFAYNATNEEQHTEFEGVDWEATFGPHAALVFEGDVGTVPDP